MTHKSKTNNRSITEIGRRVRHDTCYIAHQFQGQTVKSQGHRPTNADTQNAPYLPNGKAYRRTSKLVCGCGWRTISGGRWRTHQRQALWPPMLKVYVWPVWAILRNLHLGERMDGWKPLLQCKCWFCSRLSAGSRAFGAIETVSTCRNDTERTTTATAAI